MSGKASHLCSHKRPLGSVVGGINERTGMMEQYSIAKNALLSDADPLARWLMQKGLEGASQEELLQGYSEKLIELGVPLCRLHMAHRAFHPQFGGIGFDWLRDSGLSQERYAHTDVQPDRWLKSPLFHLLKHNLSEMREDLTIPGYNSPFPLLNELATQGATDYFATGLLFEKPDEQLQIDPNNTPEGMLISWASDAPGGFSDADLGQIRRGLPYLGLALKSASNRQMARDLLGIYLGRDAGRRVLSGDIKRGTVQQINAVICYFDLTGFTSLTERTEGQSLIAMLNDYFGLAVAAVQGHDGHVLKFMGDGLLAMFDHPDMAQAAGAALDMASLLRRQIARKNAERQAQNLPTTGFTLALHAGEILYGNIGAENRLDFTVIGPAVNLTARLSGMHSSVGQTIIVSDRVVQETRSGPHDLVSLGRYMLRGVSEPQELFTLHEAEIPHQNP